MGSVTKREFFAKYAALKSRNQIKSAGVLAYLCAAASLVQGLSAHNFAVIVDVAVIAGLALGVQIAKSRVFAVLLLAYACFNTVVMTLVNGQLSGWLLIFVGILAVAGTWKLQKEYQAFLLEGTVPENPEPEEPAVTAGQTFATVLPFIGMFLGMAGIWLAISPWALKILAGGAQSPAALLQGYRNWYAVIMGAVAFAVLLAAAGVAVSVRRGLLTLRSITIMVLSLAFPAFLGGFMVISEDVPALFVQAGEDLAQIEDGRLREAVVWLSPKSRPFRLPGPYAEGQPEPVVRYGGIGNDTGGVWMEFYVPDCLGFSLDPSALYQENESIGWNDEHARQYLIRYTDNFYLVVSAEPADGTV